MNAFVCSVMSCSEVSSRGYLVASDQHVRLQCDIEFGGETSYIFKVGLENSPQKEQKLGGKSFWKNFVSSRDGAEQSTETRRGWESLKNPTPLRNAAGPLSGLQRNAPASLVRFVVVSKQSELGRQVHCVGGQGGGRHRSVVG